MRESIDIVEAKGRRTKWKAAPGETGATPPEPPRYKLDAHWMDAEKTAVYIEWFSVEESGKGNGRRAYEAWEARLPESVKYIYLHAADPDGGGNSHGFWEAMGFDFEYTYGSAIEHEIDDETKYAMVKAIHGAAQPEPHLITSEDDEDDEDGWDDED